MNWQVPDDEPENIWSNNSLSLAMENFFWQHVSDNTNIEYRVKTSRLYLIQCSQDRKRISATVIAIPLWQKCACSIGFMIMYDLSENIQHYRNEPNFRKKG